MSKVLYQYIFYDAEETTFEYFEGYDKEEVAEKAWNEYEWYLQLEDVTNDDDNTEILTHEEFVNGTGQIYLTFEDRRWLDIDRRVINLDSNTREEIING